MAEQDPRRRYEVLAVVAICSLAVSVRLLFLARWAGTPLFSSPVGDELNFHRTALALLSEHSLGSFLYQPLYSYFLAGVYRLFGPDVGMVRTIQLAIGVGTTLLFYGLGRELGKDGNAGRWTGYLTGTIAALYGPQVFFEGQLLAPALTLPLTAGALWCLLVAVKRSKPWLLVAGGLLLGLACMGRPNLLVMLPAGLVWLLMRIRPWRRIWLSAGLLVVGVILGLSPSWIHNAVSGQGFVPVSSSGGHSFFIGNNPQATGGFHIPKGARIDDSDHAAYRRSLTLLAERAAGHDLTPAEVSAYWWHRGLDFWAAHPGQVLWLSGKKLLLALNSVERPIHHPYVFAEEVAPILGYLLSFGIVFPFAVLGVWFGRRRRAGVGLLLGCAGTYLLTMVAFYVADRYRILLLSALIPLAGLGMVELAYDPRQGSTAHLAMYFRTRRGLRRHPVAADLGPRHQPGAGRRIQPDGQGCRRARQAARGREIFQTRARTGRPRARRQGARQPEPAASTPRSARAGAKAVCRGGPCRSRLAGHPHSPGAPGREQGRHSASHPMVARGGGADGRSRPGPARDNKTRKTLNERDIGPRFKATVLLRGS